jgi:hypothetical protein
VETFNSQRIIILGEQDGPHERKLKGRLSERFAASGLVAAAYLVRVSYAETHHSFVALALIADYRRAKEIVEWVGEIFKSIFPATDSLDTIFLTRSLAEDVAKVATPFFGTPPE